MANLTKVKPLVATSGFDEIPGTKPSFVTDAITSPVPVTIPVADVPPVAPAAPAIDPGILEALLLRLASMEAENKRLGEQNERLAATALDALKRPVAAVIEADADVPFELPKHKLYFVGKRFVAAKDNRPAHFVDDLYMDAAIGQKHFTSDRQGHSVRFSKVNEDEPAYGYVTEGHGKWLINFDRSIDETGNLLPDSRYRWAD